MIGEIAIWRGSERVARGMKYVLRGDCRVLESNIIGHDGDRGIERLISGEEFVVHCSISFADEDRVSEKEMAEIGREFVIRYLGYMRREGVVGEIERYRAGGELRVLRDEERGWDIDRHGYGVVEHKDKEHRHIHVVIDGEDMGSGRVYDIGCMVYRRALVEGILRQLEGEYGLRRVRPSWEIRGERGIEGMRIATYNAVRLGRGGVVRLRDGMERVLERSRDYRDFERGLAGMGVKINRGDSGGIKYEYNGVYIRPRQLGLIFTEREIERHFSGKGRCYELER